MSKPTKRPLYDSLRSEAKETKQELAEVSTGKSSPEKPAYFLKPGDSVRWDTMQIDCPLEFYGIVVKNAMSAGGVRGYCHIQLCEALHRDKVILVPVKELTHLPPNTENIWNAEEFLANS